MGARVRFPLGEFEFVPKRITRDFDREPDDPTPEEIEEIKQRLRKNWAIDTRDDAQGMAGRRSGKK